jgi:nuclear receptor-binding protein
MSSGSLKTFLRKTKKTKQNLSKNSWKRWCVQLLAALKYKHLSPNLSSSSKTFLFYSYLHSCEEPIIHGNLTCDTIFIQNTGLLKIGSSKFQLIFKQVKNRLKYKDNNYLCSTLS